MRRALIAVGLVALATACKPTKTKEEDLKEVVSQVPWLLELLEKCETYKGTKDETLHAELARQSVNLIRKSAVEDVEGRVGDTFPPTAERPDEYYIQIKVGAQVQFTSQAGKRPIEKGGPFFDLVSQLEEGDCVIFSGTDLEPIAGFQQGKACDPRYYTRFTKLQRCPK
jgi:hypothetical protein